MSYFQHVTKLCLHCFSLCVSNNVSTVPVNDTNHITFGSTIGKEHNPFSLNFTIPSVSTVILFVLFSRARMSFCGHVI